MEDKKFFKFYSKHNGLVFAIEKDTYEKVHNRKLAFNRGEEDGKVGFAEISEHEFKELSIEIQRMNKEFLGLS